MIYKRLRHLAVSPRSTMKLWLNSMCNWPCFLIGNAPSLEDQPVHKLNNYFTIGVNRSFYAIDTTILIWQDIELWVTERKKLPKLKAVKYCRDVADPENIAYHFHLATGGYKIPRDFSLLHGRGSSGPLAFQVACLLGCDPIIFLGYDCKYRGDKTDFWGKNRFHKPHTLSNCLRGMNWVKKINERETHKTLINCSDNNVFGPKRSLDDVIKDTVKVYPFASREFFLGELFHLGNALIPNKEKLRKHKS